MTSLTRRHTTAHPASNGLLPAILPGGDLPVVLSGNDCGNLGNSPLPVCPILGISVQERQDISQLFNKRRTGLAPGVNSVSGMALATGVCATQSSKPDASACRLIAVIQRLCAEVAQKDTGG